MPIEPTDEEDRAVLEITGGRWLRPVSIYLNNSRIAGPKPKGAFKIHTRIECSRAEMLKLLNKGL